MIDFKTATDQLMVSITPDGLAKALGVSVSLVRQARVTAGAHSHRNPPKDWERVVLRLAKQKAEHFRRLAERLSEEPLSRSRRSQSAEDLVARVLRRKRA